MYNTDHLSELVTGRGQSFWHNDIMQMSAELEERIEGTRWLIPGGAGSIGSAFIRNLIPYKPAEIIIIDPDENALAHLVRDIRNRFSADILPEIYTCSLSLGTALFRDWFLRQPRFDYVFSFAARKHVRAERDLWSTLAMLECNVLAHDELFQVLSEKPPQIVFSVSTDKAADPAGLMGASKQLMEQVLFSYADRMRVQTVRFANVLFSSGSLTEAFLHRYAQNQVFACPDDIRRYFVTRQESGDICLLAGFAAQPGISVPDFSPEKDQLAFLEILKRLMKNWNLTPEYFYQESEALDFAHRRKNQDPWPVLLTSTNTPGEKAAEIFSGKNEQVCSGNYRHLKYIQPGRVMSDDRLTEIRTQLGKWMQKPPARLAEIRTCMRTWVPEYSTVSSEKNLDMKM